MSKASDRLFRDSYFNRMNRQQALAAANDPAVKAWQEQWKRYWSIPTMKNVLKDPSVWLLILANLVTLFWAVTQNWNFQSVLLVYWGQSLIIGFFYFFKILFAKQSSGIGWSIPSPFLAIFFVFHYGIFHAVYAAFIFGFSSALLFGARSIALSVVEIVLALAAFFITHLFSFIFYRLKPESENKNGMILLFEPYARIIPMHATIMLAGFISAPLLLQPNGETPVILLIVFLLLKTVADVIMHINEHRELQPVG